MAEDMVERVARAIWAERVRDARERLGIHLEGYDVSWGDQTTGEANNVRGEALAAIKAMRVPTFDMVNPMASNTPLSFALVERVWTGMIDNALSDSTTDATVPASNTR